MRYWIKLYTEILKDPKMGRLTDRQFRTCINLFALAGECDKDGALPSVADMTWTLRMNETDLLADMAALAKVGIVRCEDDAWLVCKWQERQAKAPSAAPDKVLQRVHEHRQRQRNETVTTLHDEVKRDVTPPDTETETETETDVDTEVEKKKTTTTTNGVGGLTEVYDVYQNNVGLLTKIVADKLAEDVTDYGATWVTDAIGISVANEKRSLAYIEGILKKWHREGRTNGNGHKPATTPEQKYRMVEVAGPDGKPMMKREVVA